MFGSIFNNPPPTASGKMLDVGISHAQIRAQERYGLYVTGRDFADIVEQVQNGRAIKLGPRGRHTSVYLVTVQEQDCVVAYNRKAKKVLTFLPLVDPQWA
jgi:hypothetical protein